MKKFLILLLIAALLIPAAQAEDVSDEIYTIFPPQKAYVSFTLPANPSTGYLWFSRLIGDAVIESPSLMTLNAAIPVGEGDGDASGQISTELVGASSVSQFLFTADHEGQAIVVFTYMRPGEETDQPAEEPVQMLVYLITVDGEGNLFVQDVRDVNPLLCEVLSVDEEERTALVGTQSHGEVLARFPENVDLPRVGDRVTLWYNGVMTLSLPGQINVLGCDLVMTSVTGSVVSVDGEAHSALVNTQNSGEVLALFPDHVELPEAGDQVVLWYNGIMTRSLPPQISVMECQALTVYELTGAVLSVDEEAHTALLSTEASGEVLAKFPENVGLPQAGDHVKIGFNGIMTRSIPAQITVITCEIVSAE